ncbi:Bardet-Biedl syndrome 7 protein homolog isoform X3 [Ostrinia furnacalis]|uniref:Bardet-Biedl syndrome 7 protein homolog isoform X3 n=1 Tax=Ostrinia furnacalis TaxID=93504 RepID=UPI00103A6428|nr:Bardet-Biedl syndrome 7 protein homolog isoform X3 [Ostrinia furnacalis]
MDYDLSRVDYTICGITYPDTLKILPAPGPRTQQKFVIGDKNGVLQCLSIKDEEPIVQFKTLPGKPITSVQLASTYGTPSDKIFAASGNEVKGYTKKGKVFLTIETSVSETITSMIFLFRCVVGGDLILCSGRTVTCYRDLRELHSYICEDRVLDIAAFAAPNSTRIRLLALVANKGAILLENGKLITHAAISSGPSRLAIPPSLHTSDIYAYYGAADGCIGLIVYEDSVLTNKCLMEGRGLGSVVCIGWFFGSGGTHLAVGRHDGSIQLYLIDMENFSEKPRLKFTYFCGEPVTSVTGGCIGTAEEPELIATTFSGRIFALRSRRQVSGASLNNLSLDALTARRSKLETEVARLEKQTANEREKYQRSTRSLQAGISAPPLLDIQCELSGATGDGWQEARITSAVPLDMLFIYCKRKLDMQTDSAAVLSVCSSQGKNQDLLATVRCQAGTRRLWVKIRLTLDPATRASDSVRVLIYALPAGAPRVARLIHLRLPILPYYSQHEHPELDNETRSWCQVRVSGSFSVAEITSWLNEALPGDLPRPSSNVVFARSHALLKTILVCQYQRGNAVFKSDNITTIAILRDMMSNCSVDKSIRVEISCDIPVDSCLKAFIRIQDYYEEEYKKYQDLALKKALSALDLDDKTVNEEELTLCEDYRRVWNIADGDINKTHFKELLETIHRWYADWHELSLHSKDFHNNKNILYDALLNCRLKQIRQIFSNEQMNSN